MPSKQLINPLPDAQQRGVSQIAAVLRRNIQHGAGLADLYLHPDCNAAGLADNLRAIIDVWETGQIERLSGPQTP